MEINVSGSNESPARESDSISGLLESLKTDNPPWGIIMFDQDGSVSSLCADESIIGEENAKSITLALDFAHYAFDRPDWMIEYIRWLQAAKSEDKKAPKPGLRLIKGGLDDDD